MRGPPVPMEGRRAFGETPGMEAKPRCSRPRGALPEGEGLWGLFETFGGKVSHPQAIEPDAARSATIANHPAVTMIITPYLSSTLRKLMTAMKLSPNTIRLW